jgi:hypothetical protein
MGGMLAFPAIAEDVRLHPLEAYWVRYTLEGMMQGEVLEQCRYYCNERAESRQTTMNVAGMNQTQNQRTLTVRDLVYNINEDTGTVTKTSNPMYQTLVDQVKANGTEATYKTWLSSFGYELTGNEQEIAGETCKEYASEQMMGATTCLTDDGLMLRTEVAGSIQTAVEVHRGAPRDLSAFEIPEGSIVSHEEMPASIEDLQKMLQELKEKQAPE